MREIYTMIKYLNCMTYAVSIWVKLNLKQKLLPNLHPGERKLHKSYRGTSAFKWSNTPT
jgi:hypothetical protein